MDAVVLARAKDKLDSIITRGGLQSQEVMQEIGRECEQRRDIVARPEVMQYSSSDSTLEILGGYNRQPTGKLQLTPHSRSQLMGRVRVPQTFADMLVKEGRTDVLDRTVNELNRHFNGNGLLVRRVDSVVKGILSTAYRRMDAFPVFERFVLTASQLGMVPQRTLNTDSRYQVNFILPRVFTPGGLEAVTYGASLITSDYGGAALELHLVAMRISCVNLCIGINALRKVHIGRRFEMEGERDAIELSQKTHRLDTATMISLVSDGVRHVYGLVKTLNEKVEASTSSTINVESAVARLRKEGVLTKELGEKALMMFESDVSVELLPEKKSAWRMANVLSLMAQAGNISGDARINLEHASMKFITDNSTN